MTKNPNNLQNRQALAFAQLLADIARPIALRYFRAPLDIMCKVDKNPVTVADHEIESALRQVIHERYPHHAIIGEEHGKMRGSNYSWILDPNRLEWTHRCSSEQTPIDAAVNSLIRL